MTFYIRTDEGQIAAYNPESALPRKLRSLLKLIDGKTSLAMLEESLRAFGDVRGLVQSLDVAGLIRPSQDDLKSGREPADGFSSGPVSKMAHRASATWAGTRSAHENSQLSTRLTAGAASLAQRSDALRQAETLMANFVLTHMPDQSFSILKELEALSSLEQLAATLGGYEQVVSHLGPASRDHLLQVKHILRDNL